MRTPTYRPRATKMPTPCEYCLGDVYLVGSEVKCAACGKPTPKRIEGRGLGNSPSGVVPGKGNLLSRSSDPATTASPRPRSFDATDVLKEEAR